MLTRHTCTVECSHCAHFFARFGKFSTIRYALTFFGDTLPIRLQEAYRGELCTGLARDLLNRVVVYIKGRVRVVVMIEWVVLVIVCTVAGVGGYWYGVYVLTSDD